MVNKRNLGISGLVLAAGLSIAGLNEGLSTEKTVRDIPYQGYRNESSEGMTYLVFDDNTLYGRQGPAEIVASGDPNGLEIGQRYDVAVKTSGLFGSKKVTAIEPSDDSD